jgi:hypothetical protein
MNLEMIVQSDQAKIPSRSEKTTNNQHKEQLEETSSSESESDENLESDVEFESELEWESSDESDEEIEEDAEESSSIQWLSRLHKIENKAFFYDQRLVQVKHSQRQIRHSTSFMKSFLKKYFN